MLGDNAAHSSDSREWGLLRADQIGGVVVGRVRRAALP
ncbi:S26 family signal peptidase [Streptomyces sp. ITFR-6]|nr:S26 family signal peptidase [Streptomyces sp. ITFR-6]WNI34149.1 S26 family signal peptidase [Streptomyces sp. ITFR-6]